MTERTGQCLCGEVRFTARVPKAEFGVCHCKMCQRWAGSALFAITIPAQEMELSGAHAIRRFQSSGWAERAWCGTCGSSLWYRVTEDGPHKGDYEICIGLLDDADGLDFVREIYIDAKPKSFALAGTHERLDTADSEAHLGMAAK